MVYLGVSFSNITIFSLLSISFLREKERENSPSPSLLFYFSKKNKCRGRTIEMWSINNIRGWKEHVSPSSAIDFTINPLTIQMKPIKLLTSLE